MKFVLERITQPEIEPVTLAEMKRHLRTFSSVTEDDPDITALITAAREWVEDETGRALIDQQWRLTIDSRTVIGDVVSGFSVVGGYPSHCGYYAGTFDWTSRGEISLRKSPALQVISVKSVNLAGVETTISPTTYELREADSKWPRIVALNGAPWTANMLRIVFRAGYADTVGSPGEGAEVVPVRFKQAIKLWVEANYDRDEKMMPLLLETAECLIRPEKADLPFA